MKKTIEANKAEEKVTKVVKRSKEGLIVLKSLVGEEAEKVKSLFKSELPTNHKVKATTKISQCSVMNKLLLEGKKSKEIAEELIRLKLFTAKGEEDEKSTMKRCLARVSNHISYVQGKQSRQTEKCMMKEGGRFVIAL